VGGAKAAAILMVLIFVTGAEVAYPYEISQSLKPVMSAPAVEPLKLELPGISDELPLKKLFKKLREILSGKSGREKSQSFRQHGEATPELAQGRKHGGREAEELAKSIAELEKALEELDVQKIKGEKEKLLAIDERIRAEFNATEAKLRELAASGKISEEKLRRLAEVRENYSASMKELLLEIEDVEKAKTKEELKQRAEKAKEKLKRLKREKKERFLGTELPHRSVYREAKQVTLSESLLPSYTYALVNITPANLSALPTQADLNATPEVIITPEIENLAEMLSHDPVAIYEYVRNSFDYQPYYGSLKGSQLTLWERSGNDVDLASLLVALYRSAGIPARYAYGTVEVPIEWAMNVTGISDPVTAANAFASGGVPTTLIISGGRPKALIIEHVWVEAYLPYGNYRGKIRGEGGYRWVPLDPSFKWYLYYPAKVNLSHAISLNATEFIDMIMNRSTINESGSYVTSVNQSFIRQYMENLTNSTYDYLAERNLTNLTLNELLGYREIIPEKLGVLPNSLPYRVVEKKAEFSEVPDELRHKIKFEIYQVSSSLLGSIPASSPDFSVTISMPELAGKRITLSYIPATQDDAAIIEEYGGITNVPAYLVEMKPVLRVEGEAIAVGNPVTLGENQQFVMEFISPGGGVDRVSNDVTVGAYYGVALDLGKVPVKLLEERKAKLTQWINLFDNGLIDTVNKDDITGELLYVTAIGYFAESGMFDTIIAKISGTTTIRHASENMVGFSTSVSYLFWSPYNLEINGLFIDVDRNLYSVFGKDGNRDNAKSFMLSSGSIGSALEHAIFEQMYNVSSISAIKLIQVANDQGVPIYTINQTNINEILPKLQISQEVKDGILQAVNSGKIVTIPERNIQYFNWSGIGWIVIGPETGAGAYMISGGIAGGGTAEDGKLDDLLKWLAKIPWGSIIKGTLGRILGSILNGLSRIVKAIENISNMNIFEFIIFLALVISVVALLTIIAVYIVPAFATLGILGKGFGILYLLAHSTLLFGLLDKILASLRNRR